VKILIKVKLGEILSSTTALEHLGEQHLKGKLAYKVGKAIKTISNEINLYDKARKELLNEYCVKDENGEVQIDERGNAQVEKQYIDKYNQEIRTLNDTDIELNIVLLDLDDFENIEITPREIMQLDWLIKKEEAE